MANSIFDNTIELPNNVIEQKAKSLIGFEDRFNRIFNNLRLLLDPTEIKKWATKYHPTGLNVLELILDRYPLVIFEGDVGTGKTATAECVANRMTSYLKKTGFLLKLSTRVRGEGLHGEMGNLVNDAFDQLKTQAGKRRIAFLFIDEADAIATTRGSEQMHQEEKAGVNTLIQKIDDIRNLNGRAIVILSTNRLNFLDEAIVRRAAIIMKFDRPNFNERKELFAKDFEGIGLKATELETLASLTGPEHNNDLGFTFSDLRLKLFPEIVANAFPDKPITYQLILDTLKNITPSPAVS